MEDIDDFQRIIYYDDITQTEIIPPLRRPGRPIGTKNPNKRKNTEELSNNFNTKKARRRKEVIAATDPFRLSMEAAKNRDYSAISTAKAKVKKTLEFESASKEEQKEILKRARSDCIFQR